MYSLVEKLSVVLILNGVMVCMFNEILSNYFKFLFFFPLIFLTIKPELSPIVDQVLLPGIFNIN